MLLIHRDGAILENEKCWLIDILHHRNHWRLHDTSDRLSFCNTDIEKVFLKGKLTIRNLEGTNIVSLGCILIENPDIINPEERYHHDGKNISLSEGETIVLSGSFSL